MVESGSRIRALREAVQQKRRGCDDPTAQPEAAASSASTAGGGRGRSRPWRCSSASPLLLKSLRLPPASTRRQRSRELLSPRVTSKIIYSSSNATDGVAGTLNQLAAIQADAALQLRTSSPARAHPVPVASSTPSTFLARASDLLDAAASFIKTGHFPLPCPWAPFLGSTQERPTLLRRPRVAHRH